MSRLSLRQLAVSVLTSLVLCTAAVFLAVVALAVPGCVTELSTSNAPCPCAKGWKCCNERVCILEADTCQINTGDLVIDPSLTRIAVDRKAVFAANREVDWSIEEGAVGGTIEVDGVYTAPASNGIFHVKAQDPSNPELTARAEVRVVMPYLDLVAGDYGGAGNLDGEGSQARFDGPMAVTMDGDGTVYVLDRVDFIGTIRAISATTASVTTIAGGSCRTTQVSTDGIGPQACFQKPVDLAADGKGHLFVADGCLIRKIDLATRMVSTILGQASDPCYNKEDIYGIACDDEGNLYISTSQHVIKKVNPATGEATILAGSSDVCGKANGTVDASLLCYPGKIFFANLSYYHSFNYKNLFVADQYSKEIRGYHFESGQMYSTFGIPYFSLPVVGMGMDANENCYAVYGDGSIIDRFCAGLGGYQDRLTSEKISTPGGMAVDTKGNLYVSDRENNLIRRLPANESGTFVVSTLAGKAGGKPGTENGRGTAARFVGPSGMIVLPDGNVFVADGNIRKVNLETQEVTPLNDVCAAHFAFDGVDTLYFTCGNNVKQMSLSSGQIETLAGVEEYSGAAVDGVGAQARFYSARHLVLDGKGSLYINDAWSIRKLDLSTRQVTTRIDYSGQSSINAIAGDGQGKLYVASSTYIEQIDLQTDAGILLAGDPLFSGMEDGVGAAARFNGIGELTWDDRGALLVTDGAIRRVDIGTKEVRTLIGGDGQIGVRLGGAYSFNRPGSLAIVPNYDLIIADTAEHVLLRLGSPPPCQDQCALDEQRCQVAGYQLCQLQDTGCYDWSEVVACPAGVACSNGSCGCENSCSHGEKQCVGTDGYHVCIKQPNGCNDWSVSLVCPSLQCSDNLCQGTASNQINIASILPGPPYEAGMEIQIIGDHFDYSMGAFRVALDDIPINAYEPGSSDQKMIVRLPYVNGLPESGKEVVLLVSNIDTTDERILLLYPAQTKLNGSVAVEWLGTTPSSIVPNQDATFHFVMIPKTNISTTVAVDPNVSPWLWSGIDQLQVIDAKGNLNLTRQFAINPNQPVEFDIRIPILPEDSAGKAFFLLTNTHLQGAMNNTSGLIPVTVGQPVDQPDPTISLVFQYANYSDSLPLTGRADLGTIILEEGYSAFVFLGAVLTVAGTYDMTVSTTPGIQNWMVGFPGTGDPAATSIQLTIENGLPQTRDISFFVRAQPGASQSGEVDFRIQRQGSTQYKSFRLALQKRVM